jgi:hypothetical protein
LLRLNLANEPKIGDMEQLQLRRLVADQYAAICDQRRRIEQTEAEIARCEAALHYQRCQELGADYVCRAYDSSRKGSNDSDEDGKQERRRKMSRNSVFEGGSQTPMKQPAVVQQLQMLPPNETPRRHVEKRRFADWSWTAESRKPSNLGIVIPSHPSASAAAAAAAAASRSRNGNGNVDWKTDDSILREIEWVRHRIAVERERGAKLDAEIARNADAIEWCDRELRRKNEELSELFTALNRVDDGVGGNRPTDEDFRQVVERLNKSFSAVAVSCGRCSRDDVAQPEPHVAGESVPYRDDKRWLIGDCTTTEQVHLRGYPRTASVTGSAPELSYWSENDGKVNRKCAGATPRYKHRPLAYESGSLWSDRIKKSPSIKTVSNNSGEHDSDTGIGSLLEYDDLVFQESRTNLVTLV